MNERACCATSFLALGITSVLELGHSNMHVVVSLLEKAMASHSSVLTWRIPGTGEPGGLPSMGSHRVGHD